MRHHIELPINRAVLHKIGRSCEQNVVTVDGFRWLFDHLDADSIASSLSALWSRSELPIRDWTDSISNIEVWVEDSYIRLSLEISAGNVQRLECSPPLSAPLLQKCIESVEAEVPRAVLQILSFAPGLALNQVGLVASPEYFLRPLAKVRAWFPDVSERDKVFARGLIYPDCGVHIMEFAENGIGDHYVLGLNGDIFFHDHEAHGLIRCKAGLDQVLDEYFNDPERLCDPYGSGWADLPVVKSLPEDWIETPQEVLWRRQNQLTDRTGLCLSVRGCLRALSHIAYPNMPVLGPHRTKIERLLGECRDAVIDFISLDPSFERIALNVIQDAADYWRRVAEIQDIYRTHGILFYYSLPKLVAACVDLRDASKVEAARAWGSEIRIVKDHNEDKDSIPAGLWDIDFLEECSKSGEITKEQLQAFFRRPLWP